MLQGNLKQVLRWANAALLKDHSIFSLKASGAAHILAADLRSAWWGIPLLIYCARQLADEAVWIQLWPALRRYLSRCTAAGLEQYKDSQVDT